MTQSANFRQHEYETAQHHYMLPLLQQQSPKLSMSWLFPIRASYEYCYKTWWGKTICKIIPRRVSKQVQGCFWFPTLVWRCWNFDCPPGSSCQQIGLTASCKNFQRVFMFESWLGAIIYWAMTTTLFWMESDVQHHTNCFRNDKKRNSVLRI